MSLLLDSQILLVQEYLVRDLANLVRGYLEGLPDHIYTGAPIHQTINCIPFHFRVKSIQITPDPLITIVDLNGEEVQSSTLTEIRPCTCPS